MQKGPFQWKKLPSESNLAAQNETVSPDVAEMAQQIENSDQMPPY